ncbi:hypothetical protein COOONC_06383, partial [Cooperia oncophora]
MEHSILPGKMSLFSGSRIFLKKSKVFVKSYTQKRALNFTKAEIELLEQLKSLTNSNLNTFVGISFNQGRELMVIWTYCSRNSLDYILFEKERHFGRTFQCSFIKHILKMMRKELSCFQGVDVDNLPPKYLQLPPEILRYVIAEGLISRGSVKADIYQLGMIIYQILFHTRPFADKSNLTTR